MVDFELKPEHSLQGFSAEKKYKLKTKFEKEGGDKEVRYFLLKDDTGKVRKFLPSEFYSYFKVRK